MPLTSKGEKIKSAMENQYGGKKGEQVFYASKNKGTITGVDEDMTDEEKKKKEAEDKKAADSDCSKQAHDTALVAALRKRYKTPQAVLKTLGLDESFLSKPKLAQDAELRDLLELIDIIKGAGAEPNIAFNPKGIDKMAMETEPNGGPPAFVKKEEEKKAEDQGLAGEMERGSWDQNDPQNGGGGGGGMMEVVNALKMVIAKLMAMGGGAQQPDKGFPANDAHVDNGEPRAAGGHMGRDQEPNGEAKEPEKEKKAEEEKEKPAMDKPAMDAAIKCAAEAAGAAAEKRWREMRDAERAVRPYVGEIAIACDSAEQVYRQALKALGVEGIEKVHVSALPTILSMQPKPGDRKAAEHARESFAMDEKAADSFDKMFPDAKRIKSL